MAGSSFIDSDGLQTAALAQEDDDGQAAPHQQEGRPSGIEGPEGQAHVEGVEDRRGERAQPGGAEAPGREASMKSLVSNLGQRDKGDVVEVTLTGTAANVLLLDSMNLRRYRNGQSFRHYGRHATSSPVRIEVPHGGSWHVVIDHGGRRGRTDASVRVLHRGSTGRWPR